MDNDGFGGPAALNRLCSCHNLESGGHPMHQPITLITPEDVMALRQAWAREQARVAFVPTMGALHQGHLSLVKQGSALADKVLVSIFVNPLQFGPNEDFDKYPRTLKADVELLSSLKVDAVFLPTTANMYPDGFQTHVHNHTLAADLEGKSRPGHYDGVLTVVLKLLNIVRPEVAIFGKKDYQQWRLIERMALDLCLPSRIIGGETLREADGLALSSRNRYLDDRQRLVAGKIYQALEAAKAVFGRGNRHPTALLGACTQILSDVPEINLEYAELRRQADLTAFSGQVDAPCVLLIAARVGTTRLIDNLELG